MLSPHPHNPSLLPPISVFGGSAGTRFCMFFWVGKKSKKRCGEGCPKSLKIEKNSEKDVAERVLNSIPQKTSKITDFGRVWDLPNRAETQARPLFH